VLFCPFTPLIIIFVISPQPGAHERRDSDQ
jgi:hypothetical protein